MYRRLFTKSPNIEIGGMGDDKLGLSFLGGCPTRLSRRAMSSASRDLRKARCHQVVRQNTCRTILHAHTHLPYMHLKDALERRLLVSATSQLFRRLRIHTCTHATLLCKLCASVKYVCHAFVSHAAYDIMCTIIRWTNFPTLQKRTWAHRREKKENRGWSERLRGLGGYKTIIRQS